MLTLSGITKAFGGRTLFADVSLQVNRGDRIGLVGPNGAGKTTLFSLIMGRDAADSGAISMRRGVRIGYLPQESAPAGSETVLELATATTLDGLHPNFQITARLAEEPVLDLNNAHHVEAKAKRILTGLSFRERDFERPLKELSGGWVMRAHLARLLAQEPDLLMLDEPTNHLDLDALLWLQQYLQFYSGAILLISHDREFLNQLAEAIVEIRQAKLIRYTGNYDDYLNQRQAQEAQWLAAYKNQQREIARLMEFVNRFRAKNTKASQAQSKLKQIERMEKIEAPAADERSIGFSFPQPARSGLRVITLKDIHLAYGDHVVYRGMNFEAERGQRIVLVGPNGAGKSTLLKLLAGVLQPQQGVRQLGHNVRCGYYAQYRVEMLNPEHTVLEEGLATPQRVSEEYVRTILGCFLFRGDDVFKKVSVLSGGEKSRLALVKLLLDPPNLLLMDEPTTHLDMASIEALSAALEPFEGTLIFISHDVYFIRSVANRVVHVNAGQLTHYPGGYQYYLDKTSSSAQAGLTAGCMAKANQAVAPEDRPSLKSREQKRLEAEQRQARYRQRTAQEKIVRELESEIESLEKRQAELTAELENPATYERAGRAVEVNRELASTLDRLNQLNSEWERAASKLSQLG